jgi:hypothetical protein
VPWAEFRMALRGHQIPVGLMSHKLQEFLHLQQGSSSVYEYSKKFKNLSQYGSYHSHTDEKKMSLFRQGLSPVLREHLMLYRGCSLNELVSASIEQEDACRAHWEEERKKMPLPGPNGGARPTTAWSTLHLQANHVVPLHRSSGASVHLSRWPHILPCTRGWWLHLELCSQLG